MAANLGAAILLRLTQNLAEYTSVDKVGKVAADYLSSKVKRQAARAADYLVSEVPKRFSGAPHSDWFLEAKKVLDSADARSSPNGTDILPVPPVVGGSSGGSRSYYKRPVYYSYRPKKWQRTAKRRRSRAVARRGRSSSGYRSSAKLYKAWRKRSSSTRH